MLNIRQYEMADEESVVKLSLDAWAPVFASTNAVIGDRLYRAFYGEDWAAHQAGEVRKTLADEENANWVAVHDEEVAGFVTAAIQMDAEMADGGRWGEIRMLAVDPAHQRAGVGLALCQTALAWMREGGVTACGVETGGDPGHASARALYEKAGFGLMPISRYFQAL